MTEMKKLGKRQRAALEEIVENPHRMSRMAGRYEGKIATALIRMGLVSLEVGPDGFELVPTALGRRVKG